jgi:hypothetical protein
MVHDPAASIVDHLVDADTQTVLVDKSLDRLPEFTVDSCLKLG